MQPISASCRRADAGAARGFTLLELLLVLALVALLTGLVAPRMWQWVQGARVRAGIDSVRAELEAMPRRAFAGAKRISVTPDGPLPLPESWRLELSIPLIYEANGMTSGGRLRINSGSLVLADWIIEAPAGAVRSVEPADGQFHTAAAP
jgi:general secretion pathway protein G